MTGYPASVAQRAVRAFSTKVSLNNNSYFLVHCSWRPLHQRCIVHFRRSFYITRRGVIRPGDFTIQKDSIPRLWYLRACLVFSATAIAVGCHVHYLATLETLWDARADLRN